MGMSMDSTVASWEVDVPFETYWSTNWDWTDMIYDNDILGRFHIMQYSCTWKNEVLIPKHDYHSYISAPLEYNIVRIFEGAELFNASNLVNVYF